MPREHEHEMLMDMPTHHEIPCTMFFCVRGESPILFFMPREHDHEMMMDMPTQQEIPCSICFFCVVKVQSALWVTGQGSRARPFNNWTKSRSHKDDFCITAPFCAVVGIARACTFEDGGI